MDWSFMYKYARDKTRIHHWNGGFERTINLSRECFALSR
jgi:hypothetical protein